MFLRNAGADPGFISTYWHAGLRSYIYGCTLRQHQDGKEITIWNRKASTVDAAVSKVVQAKLTNSFSDMEWKRSVERAAKQFKTDERLLASQVEALEATMANLVQSLALLKSVEMIAAVESKYKQSVAQRDELQQSLTTLRQESSYIEALDQLRKEYAPSAANWDSYTNQQKQVVMQAFIDYIEIESYGRSSGRLTIVSRWTEDDAPLRWTHQYGSGWLPEERDRLVQLIRQGASQIEIAREFPTRSWQAIIASARVATGKYLRARPRYIKTQETSEDYLARINSVGLSASASGSTTTCPR